LPKCWGKMFLEKSLSHFVPAFSFGAASHQFWQSSKILSPINGKSFWGYHVDNNKIERKTPGLKFLSKETKYRRKYIVSF
jgi:hypothetical protein